MWGIINNSKNKNITDSTLTSEQFNSFFVNISKTVTANLRETGRDPSSITARHVHNNFSLFLNPVDPTEVNEAINSLSNSTAKDLFGLSNKLLKQIGIGIAFPLSIIINKCFISGTFPEKLKVSRVIPVYKKGEENDPGNYRPISIIPVLSKPVEICFNNRIISFLEKCRLLSPVQFGFRRERSTTDAVNELVGHVVECFEGGESVSAVFCDLSKAFDCMSHQILLDKLVYYGVRGNSLHLVQSYLSNRSQVVEYGKILSSARPIAAGVPQGSILGPLLFILYVNEFSATFTR